MGTIWLNFTHTCILNLSTWTCSNMPQTVLKHCDNWARNRIDPNRDSKFHSQFRKTIVQYILSISQRSNLKTTLYNHCYLVFYFKYLSFYVRNFEGQKNPTLRILKLNCTSIYFCVYTEICLNFTNHFAKFLLWEVCLLKFILSTGEITFKKLKTKGQNQLKQELTCFYPNTLYLTINVPIHNSSI